MGIRSISGAFFLAKKGAKVGVVVGKGSETKRVFMCFLRWEESPTCLNTGREDPARANVTRGERGETC